MYRYALCATPRRIDSVRDRRHNRIRDQHIDCGTALPFNRAKLLSTSCMHGRITTPPLLKTAAEVFVFKGKIAPNPHRTYRRSSLPHPGVPSFPEIAPCSFTLSALCDTVVVHLACCSDSHCSSLRGPVKYEGCTPVFSYSLPSLSIQL